MPRAIETREHIIQQAAPIFNRKGFAATSMADIMAATGLKKGGIYNHFQSKDELAIAAFDFYIELIRAEYRTVVKQERHSIPRLNAIVTVFCDILSDPNSFIQGGCPILNTSVDSADTHPLLRQRSQQAMDGWRRLIRKIIIFGIRHQELKEAINPENTATFVIASLEGALMMSRLYNDYTYLQHTRAHLLIFIDSLSNH